MEEQGAVAATPPPAGVPPIPNRPSATPAPAAPG